jgi:hypothetical protein
LKQKYISSTRIFTNIKKCHLQSNLEKIIFVNRNWPSNPKVGCKSLFNLVELIENDLGLEKKIKAYLNRMKSWPHKMFKEKYISILFAFKISIIFYNPIN